MPDRLTIRPATTDDAPGMAAVAARAFARDDGAIPAASEATAEGIARMMQTGRAFLLAEHDGQVCGFVRHWDDEGIAWFDLLASVVPGAGHALTRALDRHAQDHGFRLVRADVPDVRRLVDAFARWGYLPVSRRQVDGAAIYTVEKRVPLLTVRETRRSDADAIEAIAGIDGWPFSQGTRPGWFVLADGDRVCGVVGLRDTRTGLGEITPPALLAAYTGRGLELWMVDRAALYAETNGFHTVETPVTPVLLARERDMEDRHWFRDGEVFRRRLTGRGDEDVVRTAWDD